MILYYHTCVDLSQQLQSNGVTTTAAILYGSLDGTSHAPLIPHFPRIHTPNSRTRHTYNYYQILYTVYGTHLHIPAINIWWSHLQMLNAISSPGCTLTGLQRGKYSGNQLNILSIQIIFGEILFTIHRFSQ